VLLNNSDQDIAADFPVPFPNDTRLIDLLTAPADIRDVPLAALGFPGFDKSSTAHALRVNPNAPATVVRAGKIHLRLSAKSAAILVRQ